MYSLREPGDEAGKAEVLERIVFFSDAVMAIAITLLVIDLRLPNSPGNLTADKLSSDLQAMVPVFTSFLISFLIIGVYWIGHLGIFRFIKRYDTLLIFLNLLFLMFIVLMPFTSSLVGSSGSLTAANVIYAANAAAVGFSLSAIWWHASPKQRLIDPGLSPSTIRLIGLGGLGAPISFLASIPVALVDPALTKYVWWILPAASTLLIALVLRRK